MAELAVLAFEMIGTAVASAGTAAAGAGAAAATASSLGGALAISEGVMAGSTALSVLQGTMSAGSVLMGLVGGGMDYMAGQSKAADARFNAGMAEVEGRRQAADSESRAADIATEYAKKTAAARVAFAGAGLDISSGQLAGVENSLGQDAAYGLAMEGANRKAGLSVAAGRAAQYRSQAKAAETAGMWGAAKDVIGGFMGGGKGLLSIANRG